MPVSYKRKNSMKKSKSSKGSKSSKLSKRVKTPKNTKPKKRLTRKSKNGSVVRKMRGGGYEEVELLLNEIFKDYEKIERKKRIKRIMSNIPETVKSNVKVFHNYFTQIINFGDLHQIDKEDFIDINLYYINKEKENQKDLEDLEEHIFKHLHYPEPLQSSTRKTKKSTENWFFREKAQRPIIPPRPTQAPAKNNPAPAPAKNNAPPRPTPAPRPIPAPRSNKKQ